MSTHKEAVEMNSETPVPQTPTGTAENTVETRDADTSDARPDSLSASVLQDAARRTSGTIEHLVIEAELVAEGKTLDNPAIPADRVMEEVLGILDRRDLEPAWIAMRGDEE